MPREVGDAQLAEYLEFELKHVLREWRRLGLRRGRAHQPRVQRDCVRSEVCCVCKDLHGTSGLVLRKQRDEPVLGLVWLVVVQQGVEKSGGGCVKAGEVEGDGFRVHSGRTEIVFSEVFHLLTTSDDRDHNPSG